MAELAFDSRLNYQKVFLNDSVTLTVADPNQRASTTITHSLGYIPNVRVWYTDANGDIATANADAGNFLYPVTTIFKNRFCYYTVTTTGLTLYFDRGITSGTTQTATIYYRIYLDAL